MSERLPARVTTPLLILITQQSLDEDYQHVADQRTEGRKSAASRRPAVTLAALAVFALLVTIAAVQTSRDAGVRSEDRGQLIGRIEARRTAISHLQADLGRLRAANVAADGTYESMGRQLSELEKRVVSLETSTGFHTMTGAGVRFVVHDGSSESDQVRDSDLRLLVNGLFEAGARGVAINGQRVTVLSAPRNSGEVVRINNVSLSPPYTVDAVGDTNTMQARFANTSTGIAFSDLARNHGMRLTMQNVTKLTLPSAPTRMRNLRHATQVSVGSQTRMRQEEATP